MTLTVDLHVRERWRERRRRMEGKREELERKRSSDRVAASRTTTTLPSSDSIGTAARSMPALK
jgi:hypothetical protein